MVPELLKEFGWSKAEFALIGVLGLLSTLLFPVVGRLADVIGVRRTALIGIIAGPLAFLAMTRLTGDIRAYIAIYTFLGTFFIATTATVYCRVVVQYVERSQGLALAVVALGPALSGAILAPSSTSSYKRAAGARVMSRSRCSQRPCRRNEVDPQPATPSSNLHGAKAGAMLVEATLPVVLMLDVRIFALQVEGPALEPSDEIRLGAARVARSRRRVDQPATAMRADVVIGAQSVGRGSYDDHRIRADVVGDEIADLGNVLDPPRLKLGLAPQPILFGARVFGREASGPMVTGPVFVRHRQRPFHTGLRFSEKARGPSCASSLL